MLCFSVSRGVLWLTLFLTDLSVVSAAMYPLGRYWSVNPAEKFWLPLAIVDPALFHVLLFCTDGAMTRLSGRKERPQRLNT